MSLIHTTGNLIDLAEAGQYNVIVQGCNCYNTMGSGIAKEIRKRYSNAAFVDYQTKAGDYLKLGNFTICNTGKFSIINAYTQFGFNRNETSADLFEYTAFALILQKLVYMFPGCNFGFPYIGCGLAGGDETVIVSMLEKFADDVEKTDGTVTLVRYGN
jgi:O-acetyl-ADP-ribose deacetylase (regulator of RNase III)